MTSPWSGLVNVALFASALSADAATLNESYNPWNVGRSAAPFWSSCSARSKSPVPYAPKKSSTAVIAAAAWAASSTGAAVVSGAASVVGVVVVAVVSLVSSALQPAITENVTSVAIIAA